MITFTIDGVTIKTIALIDYRSILRCEIRALHSIKVLYIMKHVILWVSEATDGGGVYVINATLEDARRHPVSKWLYDHKAHGNMYYDIDAFIESDHRWADAMFAQDDEIEYNFMHGKYDALSLDELLNILHTNQGLDCSEELEPYLLYGFSYPDADAETGFMCLSEFEPETGFGFMNSRHDMDHARLWGHYDPSQMVKVIG